MTFLSGLIIGFILGFVAFVLLFTLYMLLWQEEDTTEVDIDSIINNVIKEKHGD